MNIKRSIFNKKTLQRALSNFDYVNVIDKDKVQGIIEKWKYSIDNEDLAYAKEESIKSDFLTAFFTDILGYSSMYGRDEWYLNQEQKTELDSTKSDGALGIFTSSSIEIYAVIEIKNFKTDLDKKQLSRKDKLSPVEQAFQYSYKVGRKCNWVIVSNIEEIRLYHYSVMNEYESFKVSNLINPVELSKFFYLLNIHNFINQKGKSVIDKLYEQNYEDEKQITKSFYDDYKQARNYILKIGRASCRERV